MIERELSFRASGKLAWKGKDRSAYILCKHHRALSAHFSFVLPALNPSMQPLESGRPGESQSGHSAYSASCSRWKQKFK